MHAAVRSVALTLAATAMLLRAVLPAGWMPSTDTRSPLIICPMMGGTTRDAPAQHGAPRHHDSFCPFTASLAQLAGAALSDPVARPTTRPVLARALAPALFVFAAGSYRRQSPRAPPRLA